MSDDSSAATVPTAAPFGYDHRDEESHVDPWPRWEKMRNSGNAVLYTQAYDGFYVLPGYHEVVDAVRNATVFSSELKGTSIPQVPVPPLPPIHTDPPAHRQWRELINSFFSPARVAEYEPRVQQIVDEVIDPLLSGDEIDVPHDIGIPVTRLVILGLLGIIDVPEQLNEWVDDMVFGLGERAEEGTAKFMAFVATVVNQRRQQRDDGIISALFERKLRDEDRHLDDDEMLTLISLLMAAALETTSSAITAAVKYLIEHPDDAARLEGEPEIWPYAMDEFVRWATPAPCMTRTARYDTEIAGCPIPAGARLMLLFGSANHDSQEFDDPERVVLDRHPNRHLGFGMGPHRCLGSHLAKAQMALTIGKLLPELSKWRISDPSKITWNANITRGMTHLPLVRK
jgi:cytochrome P450